jgi:hypothetical protein
VVEATIYYLNWDQERENHGPATELFHKITVEEVLEEDEKPRTRYTQDDFEALYRELPSVELDNPDELEQLWKEWNRGSRRESREFLDLRHCEQCDSYIEGSEHAVTHAAQNHGYNSFEESGEPEYIHGVRSMSVGDVVEIDGEYFQAQSIGCTQIQVVDE